MNFGIWDDVADVLSHVKFCVTQFRSLGVLTPSVLAFCVRFKDGVWSCFHAQNESHFEYGHVWHLRCSSMWW